MTAIAMETLKRDLSPSVPVSTLVSSGGGPKNQCNFIRFM